LKNGLLLVLIVLIFYFQKLIVISESVLAPFSYQKDSKRYRHLIASVNGEHQIVDEEKMIFSD